MKPRKETLTQQGLLARVSYCPNTGIFVWAAHYRSTEVGKIAGYVRKQDGYRSIKIWDVSYLAHRLAFLAMTGNWPVDLVDHINHNRDDNRWENLREVDSAGNRRNSRKSSRNTSGALGVVWSHRTKKWLAVINVRGNCKQVGSFHTVDEASAARRAAQAAYGFHENHGAE